MNVKEVLEQFNRLQEQGFGDEEVFLDTNPDGLLTIGEIGLDDDGVGVIIWKE